MTEEHEALQRLWDVVQQMVPSDEYDAAWEDYTIVAAGLDRLT